MPLAKILLATDGSPEAASAARMAITFSRSLGGELHLVYVGVAPSAYAAAESRSLITSSGKRCVSSPRTRPHRAPKRRYGR